MKKVLVVLVTIILSGCSSLQFQYNTLNTVAQLDAIYGDVEIIDNEFDLRRKLARDFRFRYDFAQFAMRQPLTWQWSNRISPYRFNRYNYWNPYNPVDYTQMWNDWLWGYNSWNYWGYTPHRWSPFGYDRWGYNNWMGNVYSGYGWNNYYGWNTRYRYNPNRYNRTSTINGRRGRVVNRRSTTPNTTNSIRTTPTRTNNVRPTRTIRSSEERVIKPMRTRTTIPPVRTNNIRPTVKNSRPVINRSTPTRSSKPSTSKKRNN